MNRLKTALISILLMLAGLVINASSQLVQAAGGPYGPYGYIPEETGLVSANLFSAIGVILYIVGLGMILSSKKIKDRIATGISTIIS
ncbi:MAG: hypothetical protein U9Q67_04250 [Patescibacteria group bacterium]|nr:hypothetical protein [Patescibacteria group bacterium]